MEIKQTFIVSQPLPAVWDFFHDIPAVAACLPGAEYLGTKEDGSLSGKVSAKVGPFQASFEGEAKVKYHETEKTVDFEGKGVDRKGASRGKMTMVCGVFPDGQKTRVDIAADVQISGSLAQFGRTGLLTEIANQLIQQFVSNAEAELDRRGGGKTVVEKEGGDVPQALAAAKPLNPMSLFLSALRNWLRSLFKSAA